MALLGEIDTLADNVIATILNLRDKGSSLLIGNDHHTVADSNGVRATDTPQTEVSFYLTIK